jgi:predicted PurR-regulated permease PerM
MEELEGIRKDSELTEVEARRADLIWAGGLLLGTLLVFAALKTFPGAAIPVLVSFALAYALDPVVDWFEKRRVPRTLAVLGLFLAFALAVGCAMLYLVPAIGAELAKLPDLISGVAQKALPRLELVAGRRLPDNIRDAAAALSQSGAGLAGRTLPSLAGFAWGALGGTASALLTLVGLLVIPVLTFYLLRDYDQIIACARRLIPIRYEKLIAGRFSEIDVVLSSFIRGQLTVGAILTCMYGVGLSTARLDLAVVIGAVAGFGTMIPYVGPGIGALLALGSLAVGWQGPWQLGVVVATFTISMGAEGLFITPRVVGGRVGLSALGVLLSILVFGALFGFLGVLLAVPVAAALKVVARVVALHYRRASAGSP